MIWRKTGACAIAGAAVFVLGGCGDADVPAGLPEPTTPACYVEQPDPRYPDCEPFDDQLPDTDYYDDFPDPWDGARGR